MWARLWHFTTAPRKAQWEATQPQEGRNSSYLCKIIPLPASLYPGHFTVEDDKPGAFSCSQPGLTDSMFTKGGEYLLSLVSLLEKDAFLYPGKQKKVILRQTVLARWCVSVTGKSRLVWSSAFISVPHSLHKSLEAEKDLRTWQCEKRYCQNKSMKAYGVKSLSRMLSSTRTNYFPWIGTDAHKAQSWCPGASLESQGRGVQPASTWPFAEGEPRSACLPLLILSWGLSNINHSEDIWNPSFPEITIIHILFSTIIFK